MIIRMAILAVGKCSELFNKIQFQLERRFQIVRYSKISNGVFKKETIN